MDCTATRSAGPSEKTKTVVEALAMLWVVFSVEPRSSPSAFNNAIFFSMILIISRRELASSTTKRQG
jgi:hypothetical protein